MMACESTMVGRGAAGWARQGLSGRVAATPGVAGMARTRLACPGDAGSGLSGYGRRGMERNGWERPGEDWIGLARSGVAGASRVARSGATGIGLERQVWHGAARRGRATSGLVGPGEERSDCGRIGLAPSRPCEERRGIDGDGRLGLSGHVWEWHGKERQGRHTMP